MQDTYQITNKLIWCFIFVSDVMKSREDVFVVVREIAAHSTEHNNNDNF